MSIQGLSGPIRVLLIDHTAQLGGGEIALRNLLLYLPQDEVHAEVVLCEDGPLVEQLRMHHAVEIMPLASRVAHMRKASVGLRSLLRVRNVLSVAALAWRISRHARRGRFQIIHTNSLKSHVIGGLAGRLAGIPVVWHLRDRIAPDYLPASAVRMINLLSRYIPSMVLANSQATLNTLCDRVETSGSPKAIVVHDGCEVGETASVPGPEEPVTIGIIGRISPWKGQHIFIQAAAMIGEEFPNVAFEIIGAPLFSETEYESEIRQMATELGLRRLTFKGFVHDVQNALARLNIVVHASTVGEPFGQVIIEAMAAGKPVIATDGGGVPEIVENDVTGYLVPMNDVGAIAEAMRNMLRAPGRAREMGMRGRERVLRSFTIEKTARAVCDAYEELLDRAGRSAAVATVPLTPARLTGVTPDQQET